MDDKNVVIYSTPTCHFCGITKDFFKEHGVTYREFDVQNDLEKRQEMVEKSGGMAVPVITIDDEVIVGFDKEKLSEALGIAA